MFSVKSLSQPKNSRNVLNMQSPRNQRECTLTHNCGMNFNKNGQQTDVEL